MINNIGVTLLNKAAFAKVHFPYPWFLSAVHMLCNYIGSMIIFWTLRGTTVDGKTGTRTNSSITTGSTSSETFSDIEKLQGRSSPSNHQQLPLAARILGGHIDRKVLDTRGYRFMLAFSVLFSMNIAIGNVSLNYVSVNFNQVMRSLVPAITIALGLCLGKYFSFQRKLAVVPIMMGVAMACFGDMSYTAFGFFVTLFCVFLAALKAVASGEMLTGDLKLHPVDLLAHMAPLAMIQCLIVALLSGEIHDIIARWNTDLSPFTVDIFPMLIVWMSGFASFTLNISSLQANKLTSPLTLCIAANVKQVIMILLGTVIFETIVTPLNGGGIAVVLLGSAWYSYVSVMEKSNTTSSSSTTTSSEQQLTSTNYSKIDSHGDGIHTLGSDDDIDDDDNNMNGSNNNSVNSNTMMMGDDDDINKEEVSSLLRTTTTSTTSEKRGSKTSLLVV
jgi:Triose-phosphate Transporter family